MKYEQKSFTVPASSEKSPENCRHGWIDAKRNCVLCGATVPEKPQGVRRPGHAPHRAFQLTGIAKLQDQSPPFNIIVR